MYLENVGKLDAESLLSDDLFIELFELEDEVDFARKKEVLQVFTCNTSLHILQFH